MAETGAYDVFISYRRGNGRDIARLLQQGLERAGLSVFFDLEEITDGKFNEALYGSIERSKNFILLLTDGAMKRCANEGDWVRRELEHALQKGVNIIPLAPSGHAREMPSDLPDSLKALRMLQVSVLDMDDLFAESIAKLIRMRLRDVEALDERDRREAEETFLSRARRFKNNDGVIDSRERKELEATARALGIGVVRREKLIEQAECEYVGNSSRRNDRPDDAVLLHESPIVPSSARATEDRYKVVAGREVSYDDIVDAVGLDVLSYPECYRGNTTDCVKWAEANPDIYVMLRDLQTGHIVAYINVMPVTDECYGMIRNGDFIDVGISPEMILSYDMPLPYSIYFSSVVIHPDYRNSGVFKHLFNAIVGRFLELGRDEIFIKRMLADAVSVEGEKFCKLFGMTRLEGSQHGSTLYEVSMIPPKFRVTSKMTKQLYDYYQAKYDEEPYLFDE